MAKVLSYGPNDTPVEGVTNLTLTVPPLNFDADFRTLEDEPGRWVAIDVTSPQDQPSTLRIAQQSRPNVYAGTSIDPSVFLPTKKGLDTIIEIREVWSDTESTDPTYLRLAPVRAAITLTLPDSSLVTEDSVMRLVGRAVAALFAQGDATHSAGISALLHGVVRKD